jgi:hypothetical protein
MMWLKKFQALKQHDNLRQRCFPPMYHTHGEEMEDVYAFPEFIQHNSIATPPKQNTPFSKQVNA